MMRLRHFAALAPLFLCASPTVSQTVTVTGCSTVAASNVARSNDRAKLVADIACLDRAGPIATAQIAAARKARADRLAALVSAPAPTPTPTAKPVRLFVGDSLSIFWSGNHTGIVAKAHPELDVRSEAVGGTGIANVSGARLAAALATKPAKVTIFFGANDLANATLYPSENDWLAALFKLGSQFKAIGSAVTYGTVLNQCNGVEHNRRAAIVNAVIRKSGAVVADYAADPVLGAPGAMCDPNVSPDGVHLFDLTSTGKVDGQSRLAAIDEGAALPAPMPMPMPMPMPAPTPTSVPSPSLDGLPPVASGLNVADFLQPTWGTGEIPGHDEDVGAFRFLCAPSHNAYNDPIVYPGQPGKSHLHTFFGNTLVDANSTYASLRTTGDSTCNDKLNRSAYWIAAMMNGAGKVVMPDWLAVYYKRMPASDPRCAKWAKACVPLPRGLRYIFGFNMLDPASTPTDVYQRWWNCDGPGAVSGHFATIAEALKGCPAGAKLGAVVVAPDCWNGKDLDSPDHRSHMAYRTYADGSGQPKCPAGYPYIIPQFQLGAWFTTDATTKNWYLSSDRMPGMAASEPGTTLHADWWGAWEDSILALWTANCIDKLLNCSGGDLGQGQQIKTKAGYDYPAGRPLADLPARPAQ